VKRLIFILGVICYLTALTGQTRQRVATYTDDAYYWPVVDTIAPTEPTYDRNAREFIFLEDTTQSPDTIVMRIVDR
jgi:hypothetical protein